MVSGIECETGSYIIYDKLMSYMPNPNPNPNPKPRVRVRVRVRVGMYDISLSYMMYLPVSHSIPVTIILRSAFGVLRSAFCVLRSAKYPCRKKTTSVTG